MCGRYFISKDTISEKVMEYLRRKYDQVEMDLLSTEEVFPTDVTIVYSNNSYELMKWGYQMFNRQIINTRIESIRDKDIYQQDYQNHKCVILANGFYEWDKNKVRNYIDSEDQMIYLAGIYQCAKPFNQYSIITKQATDTKSIHDRIPIVLNREEALSYLHDEYTLEQLIGKKPVYRIHSEYTNLALFE